MNRKKDIADNKFSKITGIAFTGILIAIAILLFLNLTSGFRVKGIVGNERDTNQY